MTFPKIKKKWVIIIIVLLVFILLSPSLKDFKEFIGDTDEQVSRQNDFLVCSIYKCGEKKYLGVLKNFIKIGSDRTQVYNPPAADSTKIADDTSPFKTTSKTDDSALVKELTDNLNFKCSVEQAKNDFYNYMKFYYPDWKIYGKPVVRDQTDCVYEVQFTTINPNMHGYGDKEVMIVKLSYVGTRYYFTEVRGTLY